jgi:rhamnosyl/mannosyltransferase
MERVLQLLCDRERERVDVGVLVGGRERTTIRERVRDVPVTRAATLARAGSVGVCPTLPLELRASDADLVVVHEPNPAALVSDWLIRCRTPLVVYFHSEVVRPAWKYRLFYRPFLARVLDRADRIIVASPAMRETAEQLEGYRHKTVVIPYGIEPSALEASTSIRSRARAIRGDSPAPLLLFVGRLVPYKGVAVLIRALRDTAARLVVVGDGPLRPSLEQLAVALGVAGRIVFTGAVPDDEVLAHYHACDALVLPSITRAEAFGVVQIEAMACGKPVISTDLPSGVPWVNQHGDTGLVIPPGDGPALAAAIRQLAEDPALRARLGASARRRVDAEFTAERMAGRTVRLYGEVVAARAEHRRG